MMWRFRAMRHLRAAQFMLPALAVVLTACANQRVAPADNRVVDPGTNIAGSGKPLVSDRSSPLRQPESPNRIVVHGDTLYSIAWETGRDYRELAKWNGIRPPFTIKPGQALRVIPPVVEKKSAMRGSTKPPAKNKEAKRPDIKSSNTGKPGKSAAAPTVARAEGSKKKYDARTKSRAVAVNPSSSGKTGFGTWAWPADGQILKHYGESDSGKGLDIGGTRGQTVRATAGGRVVYQGSGLRGYGQLIIIKHSDVFLSAYAHNDRIYVKEGDVVKRGQKIADMGSTGTDRVKLHFEIRRQGVPTDPLKYLPKR